MKRKSSFENPDIQVSRELSTSFDDVKVVSTNIDSVVLLSNNVPLLQAIQDSLGSINAVGTQIVPNLAEVLEADTNAATATAMAVTATIQAGLANTARVAAEVAQATAETEASNTQLSAAAADVSADLAVAAESTATAQAAVATTQAGIATVQAAAAVVSADEAEAARDAILGMEVATGAAGSSVAWDGTTLTVPQGYQGIQGVQGDVGEALKIKGSDTAANIQAIIGAAESDFWIAEDTGDGYAWIGAVWKNTGPIRGPQGLQGVQGLVGETGKGITSIVKTSGTGAPGTTDMYTITYTDASQSSFNVYNGADGLGSGDMLKTTYDTTNNGIVDNSELVNGLTVLTAVPSGAVFTDTTYTVGDGGLTEKNFTTVLKSKLDTDVNQDIINETSAVKLYSGIKRSTWTQGLSGFTGAIRIELVNLFGYYMDGLMTIRIKETDSAAIRLDISGRWNASTSWGAYDAISDSAINVRFARDGSKVYLIIGEVGTIWSNTRVEIDSVLTNYYIGQALSFAITTINSLSGYTVDATIGSKRLSASDIGSTVQAYSANTTTAGNTFNGNSQLVQTTADGKLPALDGSLLTGLSSGVTDHTGLTSIGTNTHSQIDTALSRLVNTSGTNTGDQIVNNTLTSTSTTETLSAAQGKVLQDGKLGLAGGTMTGAISDTVVDKGTVSAGTVIFTASAGNVQKLTVGGALTIATDGWATTGKDEFLKIILVNGGSSSVTLPSINWILPDGTKTNNFATYLTAIRRTSFQTTGVDFILLMSSDAGTTVYGKLA